MGKHHLGLYMDCNINLIDSEKNVLLTVERYTFYIKIGSTILKRKYSTLNWLNKLILPFQSSIISFIFYYNVEQMATTIQTGMIT